MSLVANDLSSDYSGLLTGTRCGCPWLCMGGKAATTRAGSSETVELITTRQFCRLERRPQISEIAPIGLVGRYFANNEQAKKE